MTEDLELYRLQKESEDLERFEARLLETAALLKLFRQQHDGQAPASVEALRVWANATLEREVDPYEILTRAEIAQLWEDAEY